MDPAIDRPKYTARFLSAPDSRVYTVGTVILIDKDVINTESFAFDVVAER